MKLTHTIVSTAALTFALATAASANYYVGGTDVGELDIVLASSGTLENSGWAEAEFVNTYFADNGIDLVYDSATKVETVEAQLVDDSTDVFAFSLAYGAGYYLIKNASCNSGELCDSDTALIQNENSLDWGVLSMEELGFHFGSGSNFTISHVVTFGDMIVPEPATLGLLAIGLAGIGAARRRKTS